MRFLAKKMNLFKLAVCLVAVDFPNVAHAFENLYNNNIRDALGEWLKDEAKTELVYGSITNWNTSGVTSMYSLFSGVNRWNGDLTGWDTSSVTNMNSLFLRTEGFAANMSTWDTSSVTDLSLCFGNAINFGSDVSTWDTSGVTNMGNTFGYVENFASDVSRWNTSSVTSMIGVFHSTSTFVNPQPLCWQLGSLAEGAVLNLCPMKDNAGIYLDCSCIYSEDSVACPKCNGDVSSSEEEIVVVEDSPSEDPIVPKESDETVDEETGSSLSDEGVGDEDSSSAPSMVMKGSGLVSAVVAFAFL